MTKRPLHFVLTGKRWSATLCGILNDGTGAAHEVQVEGFPPALVGASAHLETRGGVFSLVVNPMAGGEVWYPIEFSAGRKAERARAHLTNGH